jgi:hypothetical protein
LFIKINKKKCCGNKNHEYTHCGKAIRTLASPEMKQKLNCIFKYYRGREIKEAQGY